VTLTGDTNTPKQRHVTRYFSGVGTGQQILVRGLNEPESKVEQSGFPRRGHRTAMTAIDSTVTDPQRFYRIFLLP